MLYCTYTKSYIIMYISVYLQKIIAFENGFESLMDIIQAEDYSEGGVWLLQYNTI